jgi:hypothetical protein
MCFVSLVGVKHLPLPAAVHEPVRHALAGGGQV